MILLYTNKLYKVSGLANALTANANEIPKVYVIVKYL